jgi:malonate-semialdehyde dehydrogenase (acetylating)/methylmalonate-semialdehyde dehydrogenase
MAAQQTVREIQNFVGGRPVDAETDERLDVPDPATGEVLGRVALSGTPEVDHAVRVAAEAFESWQDEPVTRRAAACSASRRCSNVSSISSPTW